MAQRLWEGTGRSVLGLRVWMDSRPLRLAPMWATLAGALASGGLAWERSDLLSLVGAMILTDGLWTQAWEILARPSDVASDSVEPPLQRLPPLPYATRRAMATRIWGWPGGRPQESSSTPAGSGWSGLAMAAVIALVLSGLLGPVALLSTGMAYILLVIARLFQPHHWLRAVGQAALGVGLPWLLGYLLFAGEPTWQSPLALGGSYMLLQASTLVPVGSPALVGVALGQLAPIVYLIGIREPVAGAGVAITLLAPVGWQLLAGTGGAARLSFAEAWRNSHIWWWAGMILSGWALMSA